MASPRPLHTRSPFDSWPFDLVVWWTVDDEANAWGVVAWCLWWRMSWWVSVLGKTVGRGCRGLRNSVGWGVVLEEREQAERERRWGGSKVFWVWSRRVRFLGFLGTGSEREKMKKRENPRGGGCLKWSRSTRTGLLSRAGPVQLDRSGFFFFLFPLAGFYRFLARFFNLR